MGGKFYIIRVTTTEFEVYKIVDYMWTNMLRSPEK